MSIAPGTRFGPYEIVDAIGAGAMGEVYLATDERLKREVAVKVLPLSLANDAERLTRFQREAEALAALNHAFIATIHGIEESSGTKALIMELVEGPTLAEKLRDGPLPVDEAIQIARQIAEALEAAHERGIIHRDLKPDNIKLRPDGTIKVLDFGIAKIVAAPESVAEESQPDLMQTEMTKIGTVLGTAAYMSPEQARGLPVDKRSDIWAFGAVLYEMLTGSRAFEGEDATDTMAAILRSEPDWKALPSTLSPAIRAYLLRCLQKEPRQRIHDIADMRLALEGAFDEIHSASEIGARRIAGRGPLVIASAIAIAAIALLLVTFGRGLDTGNETAFFSQGARFVFTPPAELRFNPFWLTGRQLAITSDGSRLIYAAAGGGLATRSIADSLAVTRLTDQGAQPIVSPDGEWVAFYTGEALRRVRVSGGSSIKITDVAGRNLRGASWGEAGAIAFADDLGLSVVPAEGGTAELLAAPDRAVGERALASPQILPGRRGVLVSVIPEDTDEEPLVAAIDLATGERDVLFAGGISPRYLPTGHIVYVSGGRLQARSFDIESLIASPDPVTVSDAEIRLTAEGSEALYDVSNSGTLVYVPDERFAGDVAGNTLIWVDREGNEEPLPLPPGGYQYANISPDGSMISMTVGGRGRNIYTFDLARNNLRPLEINSHEDVISTWSHDGDEIFFTSNRDGQPMGIYARPADGTGQARRLFTNETSQWPWVATVDGTELIVLNGDDVGRLSLSEPSRLDLLVTDDDMQFKADLSPNQEWLVYQSLETGQFEIYVVPYPETDRQKLKVSIDGGDDAHWSIDGSEIFYRTYDGAMVAVPVTYTEQGIVLGEPVKLFDAPNSFYAGNIVRGYSYDVSPADGRFLMFRQPAPEDVDIVVWQNWFNEVERLTQTN